MAGGRRRCTKSKHLHDAARDAAVAKIVEAEACPGGAAWQAEHGPSCLAEQRFQHEHPLTVPVRLYGG